MNDGGVGGADFDTGTGGGVGLNDGGPGGDGLLSIGDFGSSFFGIIGGDFGVKLLGEGDPLVDLRFACFARI